MGESLKASENKSISIEDVIASISSAFNQIEEAQVDAKSLAVIFELKPSRTKTLALDPKIELFQILITELKKH